jgi:bifunctional polynucleotide phosphatase/kinase
MWTETDSYLCYKENKDILDKLACFDIDGTIINTISGNIRAKNADDWKISFNICKDILKELSNNKFQIIFISNQYNLNDTQKEDFKTKINNVIKYLELHNNNIRVYVSLKKDNNRKPNIGFLNLLNYQNKKKIFYIGDAAGRKNDFACTDRKFAKNADIQFFTPEEIFIGKDKNNNFNWDYPKLPKIITNNNSNLVENLELTKYDKELILNVGPPGSGKTFMTKEICNAIPNKYEVVSRDIEKSIDKCVSKCEQILLTTLKSVIVDNLNETVKSRNKFIQIANKNGIKIRCLYFNISLDLAKHNNYFRANTLNNENKELIPEIVYKKYKKYFENPNITKENIDDIIKIPFELHLNSDQVHNYYKYFF